MKNDKRNYTIKVTKSGSNYSAELFEGGKHIGATQQLDFNKNNDGMKKTEHYQLNFKIDGSALPQGERVTFVSDDDDVMWVWTDTSACPPNRQHMKDVFWVDKNKLTDLRLINMDLKQEMLRFQINMVTNGTPPVPVPLDPIVNNGNNGAPEPFIGGWLAAAVTGGIVGIATALLVGGENLAPADWMAYGLGGAIVGLVVGLIASRI